MIAESVLSTTGRMLKKSGLWELGRRAEEILGNVLLLSFLAFPGAACSPRGFWDSSITDLNGPIRPYGRPDSFRTGLYPSPSHSRAVGGGLSFPAGFSWQEPCS